MADIARSVFTSFSHCYFDFAILGRDSHRVPMTDVTRILSAAEQGDPHAAEQLLPLIYEELRTLAAQKLAQEKPGQTLQATALVHEAYVRLVGNRSFADRS